MRIHNVRCFDRGKQKKVKYSFGRNLFQLINTRKSTWKIYHINS